MAAPPLPPAVSQILSMRYCSHLERPHPVAGALPRCHAYRLWWVPAVSTVRLRGRDRLVRVPLKLAAHLA